MAAWEPTVGKWNDDDNYDIKPPMWQDALKFAKERYENAGVYWEYKDGVEKKRIPYTEFVRNILKIISIEINSRDFHLMTFGALARVREQTGCSFEDIYNKFAVEELNEFPEKTTDDIVEYYKVIFNGNYQYVCMVVLLAELLFTLRMEKCPCEDWEEDIKYYHEIEKMIDTYLNEKREAKQHLLCVMIKNQIVENCDISRNRNKTAEELFAGWEY